MNLSETTIASINNIKDRYFINIDREHKPSAEEIKTGIAKLTDMIVGKLPEDYALIDSMSLSNEHWYGDFIRRILSLYENQNNRILKVFGEDSFIVKAAVHSKYWNTPLKYCQSDYVRGRLSSENGESAKKFIDFLKERGYTDDKIISIMIHQFNPFEIRTGKSNREPSGFAEFLKPLLEEKRSFLNLGGHNGKAQYLQNLIFSDDNGSNRNVFQTLVFLYELNPKFIEGRVNDYFIQKNYNKISPAIQCIRYLLEKEGNKYSQEVIKILNSTQAEEHEKFEVYYLLHTYTLENYSNHVKEIGKRYMDQNLKKNDSKYFWEQSTGMGPMSVAYSKFLLQENQDSGIKQINEYLDHYDIVFPHYLKFLEETFEKDCVPYLIKALYKKVNHPKNNERYTQTLFEILDKYNYEYYFENIIDFCVNHATKFDRSIACPSLSKYNEKIIPKADDLLSGKTVNERITGALILSEIDNEEIKNVLNEAVDNEKNDDTRNIMLDSLSNHRFSKQYDFKDVQAMIEKAEKRKKLSNWNEKGIEEADLPPLYWKDKKQKLDQNAIRFLFYRMRQTKGLNSDIEAKQLIINIEKSEQFAYHLLQSFVDINSDTKFKYYLTIAGLLGSDGILNKMHSLFRKSVEDKRVIMAEYILGAIAMIGSNKALRIIEVISRKYANKKPKLSLAAIEALDAAANELGITKDELADRIVPDFGFNGIYKEFTVENETYKAFVNSEFNLCYFNEDNKMRKSLPKNTNKEIISEFKAIEKEIRDIVKSQSGRLEKYLTEGHKWTAEQWVTFFKGNPVMFVYAMKLLWAVFDEKENLKTVFYCSEDTTLYNVDDDEVEIEDGDRISILHPVDLNEEQLNAWKSKVYDLGLLTIFPIIDRPFFKKNEYELNGSISKAYFDEDIPKGADFVAPHLTKRGWLKNPSDGGMLEFTKILSSPRITAYANIEGPYAWYQGGNAKATVYEISFWGQKNSDKILIHDIPSIWFSEVMSDIDSLIKSS